MSVTFEDHLDDIMNRLGDAVEAALNKIGQKAVEYAQDACPVGNVNTVGSWAPKNAKGERVYRGGTLRDSITHAVNGNVLSVGSAVNYAPYVELGTGPHFKPPPEWMDFDAPESKGTGRSYVTPRPFIRPAFEDHADEYRGIAEDILRRI